MVRVIAHPEPLPDDLRHPTTGPKRGRETEGLRTLEDPPCQAAALSGAQLGGPSRCRARLEPFSSPASVGPIPPTNRPAINAQAVCDHMGLDALLQQLHSTESTIFQFLRGSVRSHATSVTPHIRTLVTQVSIAASSVPWASPTPARTASFAGLGSRDLPSQAGLPRCVNGPSPRAVPITPVDRKRAHFGSFPLPLRPSPAFRRVGVHVIPFEACSGFTRVTARGFAHPPMVGFTQGFVVTVPRSHARVATGVHRKLPG